MGINISMPIDGCRKNIKYLAQSGGNVTFPEVRHIGIILLPYAKYAGNEVMTYNLVKEVLNRIKNVPTSNQSVGFTMKHTSKTLNVRTVASEILSGEVGILLNGSVHAQGFTAQWAFTVQSMLNYAKEFGMFDGGV